MLPFLAALVASTAANLPSVDSLIARHAKAVGRLTATTARWSGSIKIDGETQQFEVVADYTGRYRETWTSVLGSRSRGFDGTVEWWQDEDGQVTVAESSHTPSFAFTILRLNDLPIQDPRTATVGPPIEINGRTAYVLHITDSARPIDLYIDTATTLVDGADAGSRHVRYAAYRRINGVAVPTVIEETAPGATETRTIETFQFNVHTGSAFDKPANRDAVFPEKADEVATSFDVPHGLIMLRATINGRPSRLLLDSGSSSSVIDINLAKQLGLPMAGRAEIEGVGLLSGMFARIDSLQVAGVSLAPFVVEAVPLKLPEELARQGIDGVLGYDFLSRVVTRIDYRMQEIRFTKPSAFKYTGTGAVLPLILSSRVPIVAASTGLRDQGDFTVDTGNDQGLVLYSEYADAHPGDLAGMVGAPVQSSSGVGGRFKTKSATVGQFSLGAFTVTSVPAQVVVSSTGAFTPGAADGLIGNRLLGAFRDIFLDYPNKRLILER